MRVFSICVLVYFLACPSVSLRSQNGGNREPGIVAHRGYWNTEGAAQNSVTALKNAQKMGLYGSEMDVWLTKDGYLVVGHDKKMNGLSFQDTDYDLLKDMKLSNGEKLPQLKDFLVQLKQSESPTKLFIEIKKHDSFERNMTVVKAVLDTVRYYKVENKVQYITFNLDICKELVRIDPEAVVACLKGGMAPAEVYEMGIRGIHYHRKEYRDHPQWIREAQELGMTVNVQGINTPEDLREMVTLGVNLVSTDNPVMVLDSLPAIVKSLVSVTFIP